MSNYLIQNISHQFIRLSIICQCPFNSLLNSIKEFIAFKALPVSIDSFATWIPDLISGTLSAASNTEYRRGQASGLYKTDVVHHHVDKDLSSMSKEELMDYMENKYVNNMKDVTPKEDVIESTEELNPDSDSE